MNNKKNKNTNIVYFPKKNINNFYKKCGRKEQIQKKEKKENNHQNEQERKNRNNRERRPSRRNKKSKNMKRRKKYWIKWKNKNKDMKIF